MHSKVIFEFIFESCRNVMNIYKGENILSSFYANFSTPDDTFTFGLFCLGCTYKGKGNSQMELAIVAFDFPVIRISHITR